MKQEDSDSDDDTALFGVSLASLANAIHEAAADDEAEDKAMAAATTSVGAVVASLHSALLTNDTANLEGDLSALSQSAEGFNPDDTSSVLAAYAAPLRSGAKAIAEGRYLEVLQSSRAASLMETKTATSPADSSQEESEDGIPTPVALVRSRVVAYIAEASSELEGTLRCGELLLVGIASLNLFLQANYTGPDLQDREIPQVGVFLLPPSPQEAGDAAAASAPETVSPPSSSSSSQCLPMLSVDGETPYPGSSGPQLLLLARVMLSTLADPTLPLWHQPVARLNNSSDGQGDSSGGGAGSAGAGAVAAPTEYDLGCAAEKGVLHAPQAFAKERPRLRSVPLKVVVSCKALQAVSCWWAARSGVTHQRLLIAGESPTPTLWAEVEANLRTSLRFFNNNNNSGGDHGASATAAAATAAAATPEEDEAASSSAAMLAVECWLELGLAQFHFEKGDLGKASFKSAQKAGDLDVLVTGQMGKRTKFQRKSMAQMVIKAKGRNKKKATATTATTPTAETSRLASVDESGTAAAAATAATAASAAGDAAGIVRALTPVVEGGSDPAAAAADAAASAATAAVPMAPKVELQAEDSILYERTQFDKKTPAVGAAGVEGKQGQEGETGVNQDDDEDGEDEGDDELSGEYQSVLLALCLDVKNSNPKDGLTTEEMRPYVERVLLHHANWTIYSTGLLQRAWLDFESHYAKDRATLQLQALVDQHGQELTFTQMSREAIENSAPAQDRLRFVHSVVYPPRWELRKDLGQRYKALGILVSAAEIFVSLELWDDAVECYARMGKQKEARALVQEAADKALAVAKGSGSGSGGGGGGVGGGGVTPRMLCALGDLSNAPESTKHYEEAWTLSQGRYAKAQRLLGREAVNLSDKAAAAEHGEKQKGSSANKNRQLEKDRTVDLTLVDSHAKESQRQLQRAEKALELALSLQPSHTSDWFVLGTVRMRLAHLADAKAKTEAAGGQSGIGGASSSSSSAARAASAASSAEGVRLRWQGALTAFSTVVAHEPDEGDAWGNVGAIHMHLKKFDLACAAFTEGLKASRENWRMWENRLISTLQAKPASGSEAHYAGDAVYSALQLVELNRRGIGRGVDTPMLAAVVSSVLKAEGCSTADASSTPAQVSRLSPALVSEALEGEHFALKPVARRCGELLTNITGTTAQASADARAWEVFAIFNLAVGRRFAGRSCRLRHVRTLSAVTGWEKRGVDMEGLAQACAELVFAHSLPTAASTATTTTTTPAAFTEVSAASPPPPPATGAAAAAAATPAAAHVPTEVQQLYAVAALLKGFVKKSQGFGAAGASGDKGREKLKKCLEKAEALLAAVE